MEYAWDTAKAAANLVKHGVAYSQAATVLADALALTVFDDEHSAFEDRWFTRTSRAERRATQRLDEPR